MRIGIELGGTNTEVIALDDAGAQRFRHRLPAPRGEWRRTLATMAAGGDVGDGAR
ncbi:fructokinase, partial [Salmonella enterica subsp. enterica serovar Infantis]